MELTLSEKQLEVQETFVKIISNCWENETFKQELINNPQKTIEGFIGKSLNISEGKKLVVVDQMDDNTVYINIAAPMNTDNLELTDEQLEMVAGGEFAGLAIGLAYVGLFAAGIAIGQAI